MGTFKSSMMLGSPVTTTVWSKAVIKAPRPITTRIPGVGRVRSFPSLTWTLTGCVAGRFDLYRLVDIVQGQLSDGVRRIRGDHLAYNQHLPQLTAGL